MTLSLRQAAIEAPERGALIVAHRSLSFAELAGRVEPRIAWLARHGPAEADALVALVGTTDLATLEVLYALVELGRPVALIHPRLTAGERRALVEHAGLRFAIDPLSPAPPEPAEAAPLPRVDEERCLAVLFTSGTTGTPKGIVLSRRAFTASARASEQNLGWRDDDRWLLGLPIAHVGGLSILTRCLLARRTVVIAEETAAGRRLDPEALIRTIHEDRVTLLSLVPTQLEWLLSHEPRWTPPEHLRAVLLGGAAARPALLEEAARRGVPVLTTYGLTEACSQVTTQPLGTVNRGERDAGAPMEGTEVRIARDSAIEVRGPTLLSGYHPPDTPLPLDGEGWLRTDDVGRLDAEGRLHVLGRRGDVVITGGENVHPLEVEAVLERCAGVARACVFGIPDDAWGERLAAALVASGEPPNEATLKAFLQAELAAHRRPRLVAWVGAFEMTAAGKLDRPATARACRARLHPLPG